MVKSKAASGARSTKSKSKATTKAKPGGASKPRSKAAAAKSTKTVAKPKAAPKARTGSKAAARPKAKPAARPTTKPAARPKATASRAKSSAVKKTAPAKAKTAPKEAPKSRVEARKPTPPKPPARPAKPITQLNGFTVGDHVVYPSHGVGEITAIEDHVIADTALQVFVVTFDKEKMTLRIPVGKVETAGMRRLSSVETMEAAVTTLRGRARTRRVMWSRRAQEYEAKLNSGDPISIAEVVRDLHRNVGQPDQSYSERQMYEAAIERLAREFAAVENTDTEQATEKLEQVLRAA